MFHLLVQSSFVGAAFIVGMFVMCMILAGVLRSLLTKELFQAKTAHEESLAALKERNAQWRPSQLDYFAESALAQLVFDDLTMEPKRTKEETALLAFSYARAMVAESAAHRNYMPDVPDKFESFSGSGED